MNLVMLDIDGTLTQSYEYDKEIFGLAIGEVLNCPAVDTDLYGYVDKTSTGVTQEAIRRITGRNPSEEQLEEVKRNVFRRLEGMYQVSPEMFGEVPGARCFLERLRGIDNLGIAIATGCWKNEALFKLQSSGLKVDGIPMATSDDDKNRTCIMQLAAQRARAFYTCSQFARIIYIGDGPWDLQEARSLGFGFIGIGPRVKTVQDSLGSSWYPDFLNLEAVVTSIAGALRF
jgi:phosphoglycolate phosphatase-like HAD superfamily hydrolase